MIELNKNMEVSKDFSGLRAKAMKNPTKIPGILFRKGIVRKRVVKDINKVTTKPIKAKTLSVKPISRFDLRTASIIKNKNRQFEDEITVGFYKRRAMNQGNKSVTKLNTVPTNTNIVNHFEGTTDSKHAYYDSNSNKEAGRILRNTDYTKQNIQEKVKDSRSLRINVDDYIKRISITDNIIKENPEYIPEIKSTYSYSEKVLNDRQYYSDNFIRGKIDPETESNEFIITNAISNSVKTPISDNFFIRTEQDNTKTFYPNSRTSEKYHLKSSNAENTNVGAKFVNNKRTQMLSNNPVLYKDVIEKVELKKGNSNEIKLKSKMVSYRTDDNQDSHDNHKILNTNKDVARTEINEIYLFAATANTDYVIKHHLPPKSLPVQVEEENVRLSNSEDYERKTIKVKKNNNKRIDLQEYHTKELSSQIKNINTKEELLKPRFTIESKKNNTRHVNSNMVSTGQDFTTRESKWNKIRNYVFKSHTDKYATTYRLYAKQNHKKELNIDSDKNNKEIPRMFDVSQRSVKNEVKDMNSLLIAANTALTTNKMFHPTQVTSDPFIRINPEDNKMYQPDFGTIKVLNLNKEVTALELEKLEPVALKKQEESIKRVLSERKAQRQAKLDLHATIADRFGARRLGNHNIDNFDEGQTETVGQMEDNRQVYQFVPQPKDPNIYLYMENF